MDNFKKVINSSILEDLFDIPANFKNKKVVITISDYEDRDSISKKKSLMGSLSKYKNESLIKEEGNVWAINE